MFLSEYLYVYVFVIIFVQSGCARAVSQPEVYRVGIILEGYARPGYARWYVFEECRVLSSKIVVLRLQVVRRVIRRILQFLGLDVGLRGREGEGGFERLHEEGVRV